ncbi:MAG: ABC transporter ATP-binding protein [Hydrogenibacillus sp.]|nr:ABC transporter ATP-binding protein [Hydrogenibacillus sp.]
MGAFLDVRAVAKTFVEHGGRGRRIAGGPEAVPVLRRISLSVQEGQFVALVGPSGAGKSTLLNIIAGLLPPDDGEVRLQGERIDGRPGRVAYMMQDDLLFPWQAVREHVALPLLVRGVPRGEALRRAEAILHDFGLLGFADRYPAALSGGMRQRAALARAYLQGSPLLLLDEPFGRLDAITRSALQEWLEGVWSRERRTILMVTHDVEEALYLADRVVVLSPRPAEVAGVVDVPFARPRRRGLRADPAFVQLRAKLTEQLVGAV